jgi:hypothetical protein
MDTKLDFKIQTDNYVVIGQGQMLSSACQIGEWWITPAQDYTGKIPVDIQKKLFEFLNQRVAIQGILIAEDMRVIEAKREKEEQKREANQKMVDDSLGAMKAVLNFTGLVIAGIFWGLLIAIDPMLIAVLEDGRWICLGTWYE